MIYQKLGKNLKVPLNFKQTVVPYNPNSPRKSNGMPMAQVNDQTIAICNNLNIDDPVALLLMYNNGRINLCNSRQHDLTNSFSDVSNSFNESLLDNSTKDDVPQINIQRSSLSLPLPKSEEINLSSENLEEIDLLDSDDFYLNSNNKRVSPTMQDDKPVEANIKDIDVIIELENKKSIPIITSAKKFKRRNEQIYTSLTEDVY